MGGVCPAIVASALFGVALLSAGISSAAEPVQLRSRLGDWCLDGPNGNNAATVVDTKIIDGAVGPVEADFIGSPYYSKSPWSKHSHD